MVKSSWTGHRLAFLGILAVLRCVCVSHTPPIQEVRNNRANTTDCYHDRNDFLYIHESCVTYARQPFVFNIIIRIVAGNIYIYIHLILGREFHKTVKEAHTPHRSYWSRMSNRWLCKNCNGFGCTSQTVGMWAATTFFGVFGGLKDGHMVVIHHKCSLTNHHHQHNGYDSHKLMVD